MVMKAFHGSLYESHVRLPGREGFGGVLPQQVKEHARTFGDILPLVQIWAVSQPLFYTLLKKILNTDPLEASGLSLIKRKYIA